ncbi:MAG: hypothetical protein PHY66_08160 [Aliarcobacter sp.]|nr:hypothetical protein [Aliarcobacter sp.]MDD2887763.1 hypothetical protein [Aliarcobacter sp.]
MDICKFEKGLSKIYKVNRNNFEEATNKDKNYIKLDKKGKNQYYGYCPECDNPIVLVNLFVTQEKNGKPIIVYGKHSVEKNSFDSFDSLKYERCPLRNKNRISFSAGEKHTDDELAEKIKDTIINNACKIKYFISKIMGIEVSPKLFILLIKEFHKSQGYYYKGLTKGNLPYLILYLSHQKSIEWQYIKKGCRERKEIEEKSKYFIVAKNRQILLKENYKNELSKPSIVTVFKDHSYNTNNEQSFIYQVFEKFNKKEYLLYGQKIDFDISYFYNLLNFEAKDKKCEIEEEVRKILK